MTIKTFLISAGTGAILPVLFAMVLLAIGGTDDSDVFLSTFVLYALVWLLFLFAGIYTHRTLLRGMMLKWLTVTTPLWGLFIAGWWVDWYQDHVYWDDQDAGLISDVLVYGEAAGLLFFLIMLQPCFKRWYVKWYSLPEI